MKKQNKKFLDAKEVFQFYQAKRSSQVKVFYLQTTADASVNVLLTEKPAKEIFSSKDKTDCCTSVTYHA